jgi:Mg-chelatase subunit ChlD
VIVAFGAMLLAACADPREPPYPIEGSTWRIDKTVPSEKAELLIEFYNRRAACLEDNRVVDSAELEACVPRVERAAGVRDGDDPASEVHVAFTLRDRRDRSLSLMLPLTKEDVSVQHMGSFIPESDFELIPHGRTRTGQLFVVMVDGSGSMFEGPDPVVDRVEEALLTREVIDAFFPGKDDDSGALVRTGVVIVRFTDKVTGLDGKPPVVLTDRKMYRETVQQYLRSSPKGYTHLYDAVEYGAGDLLKEPAVAQWLAVNVGEPTLVVLTDGFNNEAPDDLCRTNAPRLAETLHRVAEARLGAIELRPTIYTVGLGNPLHPRFKVPAGLDPTPTQLCGKFSPRRINGDLEKEAIDNASLAWIATVGGGISYVERAASGVAKVFEKAAAERYKWYEIRYRVQWFHTRRSFDTTVFLNNYARADSSITILPGPWMDAPTGTRVAGESWSRPTPLVRAAALVLPILGLLVSIGFVTPAMFNARRALLRGPRKRK